MSVFIRIYIQIYLFEFIYLIKIWIFWTLICIFILSLQYIVYINLNFLYLNRCGRLAWDTTFFIGIKRFYFYILEYKGTYFLTVHRTLEQILRVISVFYPYLQRRFYLGIKILHYRYLSELWLINPYFKFLGDYPRSPWIPIPWLMFLMIGYLNYPP